MLTGKHHIQNCHLQTNWELPLPPLFLYHCNTITTTGLSFPLEVPVPLREGDTQNYLFSFLCAMKDVDLKVWVLTTKVTTVKTLLEIFARTGEKSLPTSCRDSLHKGNSVQSCMDNKNGDGHSPGCQCGKEDEGGCCFTCSHSGDKPLRPPKILIVS